MMVVEVLNNVVFGKEKIINNKVWSEFKDNKPKSNFFMYTSKQQEI